MTGDATRFDGGTGEPGPSFAGDEAVARFFELLRSAVLVCRPMGGGGEPGMASCEMGELADLVDRPLEGSEGDFIHPLHSLSTPPCPAATSWPILHAESAASKMESLDDAEG